MFSPMEKRRSKLKVAIESLLILLSHLRPEDSLGLVVYNTTAKVLFPLTRISALDLGIVILSILLHFYYTSFYFSSYQFQYYN